MKKRWIDILFPEGTSFRNFLRKWHSKWKTFLKLIHIIFQDGIKEGWKRFKEGSVNALVPSSPDDYKIWIQNNDPTIEELEKQKNHVFSYQPKISILVPMYHTPVNFFEELVHSLQEQTYSNWELCLADGSEEENEEIRKIIQKEDRIQYQFLNENKGISENSNSALKLASGDFIGLLDHDDLLTKDCLYEIVKCINENPEVEFIYTDEDKIVQGEETRYEPHFKPDFAIDTLRSNNYICHFSVFKKELMDKLEGFRSAYDGAQDYDIILRMTENTNKIVHIPKILYHWRVHQNSTARAGAAKPYAFEAGIKVLQDHLERIGLKGEVVHGATLGTYQIDYEVIGSPKVSILIPNKDGIDILKTCIQSILKLTTYSNYEIVVIENNSEEAKTFEYYKQIEEQEKIKIIYYPEKGFNYSKIINYGVKNVDGDYVIQLNNDTELLTKNWLERMLGYCQRQEVGAVGVKLYYPDKTIQHAGVVIGIGGVAGHVFKNISQNKHGYFSKDSMIYNYSAVTAACIMTKREIYEQVGFMNEELAVAFNDVDFCLKIRQEGKLIVYNPFVEFIHYESKTRGYEDNPEKVERFNKEIRTWKKYWDSFLEKGDPYYNKNLRLDSDQCAIRKEKVI